MSAEVELTAVPQPRDDAPAWALPWRHIGDRALPWLLPIALLALWYLSLIHI